VVLLGAQQSCVAVDRPPEIAAAQRRQPLRARDEAHLPHDVQDLGEPPLAERRQAATPKSF